VLKPVMDHVAQRIPQAIICLHVDDLCVTTTDTDAETSAHMLIDAAEIVDHQIAHRLGMQFAADKGYVIASTLAAARLAASLLPMKAQAVNTVRRLGVDHTFTAAKQPKAHAQTPTRWHRMAAALRNAKGMPSLFPQGAPGIFACGILPAALYGSEHHAP
jgi:hypothetical protein